jgi:nucleotide-binding universal stress UspA family protein
MHHKILIGLDNGPSSWHAFERALTYAARNGASAVGLVVESPLWTPPESNRYSHEAAIRVHAEGLAQRHGVPLEYRVRHGYPAHTIAEQARLLGCDLVVLGHTDHAMLRRWLTGSVSDLVRHEAHCRVVVVHTGEVLDLDEAPRTAAAPIAAY